LFVYDRDKGFAQELAKHVEKDDDSISGMFVAIRMIDVVFKMTTNISLMKTCKCNE